jgi:hypothetical protein
MMTIKKIKPNKLLLLAFIIGVIYLLRHFSADYQNCVEHPLKSQLLVEAEIELSCYILRSNCSTNKNYTEYYSEQATLVRITNCHNYFDTFWTTAFQKPSDVEMTTTLAFAIMAHNEITVLEVLLATVFRQLHSYCIFVDAKADPNFYKYS